MEDIEELGRGMTLSFVRSREREDYGGNRKAFVAAVLHLHDNGGGLDLKDKAERRMWFKKRKALRHTCRKKKMKRRRK